MQDRADPHARERAFAIARQDPPSGVSPEAAAVAIADVLDSIGDAREEVTNLLRELKLPLDERSAPSCQSGRVVQPTR
jgi:hypothetical protein